MSLLRGFMTRLGRPGYGRLAKFLLLGMALVAAFLLGRLSTEGKLVRLRSVAFASPLPDVRVAVEQSLPDSVAYRHKYDFTADWFTWNIPVWTKVLEPFKGRPDVRYMEIGAYEGRSVVWMLENILTNPSSRVTGIDIFDGPYKERYFANLERTGASAKVTTITGYSQLALRELPLDSFDIVYVDGSHLKSDVLEDAVLSWRLLRAGGVMIFDDYRWAGCFAGDAGSDPTAFPKAAIDAFLACFEGQYEVLHNSYQLILKKKPRPHKPSPSVST